MDPGVDSNRDQYQKSSWRVKGDQCLCLSTPHSCMNRLSRNVGASMACNRDSFTFYLHPKLAVNIFLHFFPSVTVPFE
jgi:hypothetical protein